MKICGCILKKKTYLTYCYVMLKTGVIVKSQGVHNIWGHWGREALYGFGCLKKKVRSTENYLKLSRVVTIFCIVECENSINSRLVTIFFFLIDLHIILAGKCSTFSEFSLSNHILYVAFYRFCRFVWYTSQFKKFANNTDFFRTTVTFFSSLMVTQ